MTTAAAAAVTPGLAPWLTRYPQHVDWNEKFTPTAVPFLLDNTVAKYPSKTATSFLGATMTYGEIGRMTDKFR